MEFGIGPLKLFEFRDLQRMWEKKKVQDILDDWIWNEAGKQR